jgi:hypothetical protein
MKIFVPVLLLAVAVIPFTTLGFVPTVHSRPSSLSLSTATTLKVSVGGTSQLTPPKNVKDLAETAEELYNQNVQTTYGYVF